MPHIHEKVDFISEVFVVHKDKVLLRKHDKYKIWLGVGGHVELDEDPNEAAIREAKEEVGLDIRLTDFSGKQDSYTDSYKELTPPIFLNRHAINDTHEHIALIYFATSESDTVVAGGRDRSDEWKWFTKEELEDTAYGVREHVKFYARRALEMLSRP